ncbi:MAG: hypothetical protein HGA78_03160 [Nitrospirales bacterium]|nr:hypothetical protein [Nitrospirales bacterium]
MIDDPKTDPLREWNRLARDNAENAIVSSMFEASLKASEPIEIFSSWLLVATAAVASFLIANVEKILPLIGKPGFVTCGVFLCVSCIFGLLSKVFAVRCKIGTEAGAALRKTFGEHLAAYKLEEEKIQQGASFWGITLQTGIRIERVLQELMRPFPAWVRWLAGRHFKKYAGNPQIGYLIQVNSLQAQGLAAFIQALCFLGFLGVGFIFAAAS